MKQSLFGMLVLIFCHCGLAQGGPDVVRLPITRDTWLSNAGKESDGSNGGSSQMKLKSVQEMSLIDVDVTSLTGRSIKSAQLHVHLSGPEILHRVTVSTFAADWVEGEATNYDSIPGVSTYNHRKHPDVPWAYPGSYLNAVMLGEGGTIWQMADASSPDADRWQTIAVDPRVVAARVAGISTGFLLFDDTGSEWKRDGNRFTLKMFPNRVFHSKDSRKETAPYLTVELGPPDIQPPLAPTDLKCDTTDLPAGEAMMSWITPEDAGPAGVIGFLVEIDGTPVPRYLIPAAGKPGRRVVMHLRDLNLAAGKRVQMNIKAIDGAGNAGPASSLAVTVSNQALAPLPGKNPEPFKSAGSLPKLGGTEIAIIDALDKVQAVTGEMVPPEPEGYLSGNHLWDGKAIHMAGAKGEIVSFQILVRGSVEKLNARVEFEQREKAGKPRVNFYRLGYVQTQAGPMPDPLIPASDRDGAMLTVPSGDLPNQKNASLFCEIEIPRDPVAPGIQTGMLILTAGGNELKIPLSLTIWDFSLPDILSFIPEMNCYDPPDDERAYYALAHRNRTVLNCVPTHHNGTIADDCASIWNAKTRRLDWTAWDKRFGPYFDGSAFHDGRNAPLEVFYLPLFENWPTPMEGNYNGDYWADRAFPEQYKKDFIEASLQFAEHFNQHGWNDTIFQCFFNGKNNYKQKGWSRGTCPWLLDEPTNFQDFWALRFYGELFHAGVNQAAPGNAKLMFRADISRPEWQRDALDDVLDYNVVQGGAFQQFTRMVIDRKRRLGQVVVLYGTTNDPADSNLQPAAWCLDSWTLGADGVLPWQTLGEDSSWKKADALSLFYPGKPAGQNGPVASIRLKSYLRGEQDIEYLTMLAKAEHQSRYRIARVRAAMNLKARRKGTGFTDDEDSGVMDYAALRPVDLWALRVRVGEVLNALHPKPERKLVKLQTPKREPDADAASQTK